MRWWGRARATSLSAAIPAVCPSQEAIAPIGTAFSNSYNARVKGFVGEAARRGVSVHYLDLDRLADRVEADPAASA